MASVGGSIGLAGIGVSTSMSHSVSATVAFVRPGDGDDVAGFGALDRHAREAAEGQQLGRARALDHACPRGESALMLRLSVMAPDSMRPVSTRPR